jgi:hypothetical protein
MVYPGGNTNTRRLLDHAALQQCGATLKPVSETSKLMRRRCRQRRLILAGLRALALESANRYLLRASIDKCVEGRARTCLMQGARDGRIGEIAS